MLKIKNTPARLNLMEFLDNANQPVDVEQAINYLRSKNLNTNKVTVYRILDLLFKNSIVSRLQFGEGKFRYEINRSHHHHLVCKKCANVEDVQGDFLEDLEHQILIKEKFKVTSHSLEFFGLCKNCQS